MQSPDKEDTDLSKLGSVERSILLSFLSLSERPVEEDGSPIDELSLSIALRASMQDKSPN